MKLILLSPTDQKFNLATHKVVLNAADVAALGASTTGTKAIVPESGTFPIGTTARFCHLRITSAWDASDASINSLLIEIGDGGDTDRLLAQTELAEDGTEVDFKTGSAVSQPYTYLAADTIDALFTVSGGGSPLLSEINAGEVEIYLYIHTPSLDMGGVDGPI